MKTLVVAFACLLIGTGCRSTYRSQNLSAMQAVEESYSGFARLRIEASSTSLLVNLNQFQQEGETSVDALLKALEEWRETLAFFVHVFPKTETSDPYLELLLDAEEGIYLLNHERTRQEELIWAFRLSAKLLSEESRSYRQELNRDFATRRKASELPPIYWAELNFIPALNESLKSNLRDYFKEQKKALRRAITKLLINDPLFPGQEQSIAAIRERTEVLISIHGRYQVWYPDAALSKDLRATRDFYSQVLIDLARYYRLRADRNEGRATTLGLKLQKNWELEKRRLVPTWKTDRDEADTESLGKEDSVP